MTWYHFTLGSYLGKVGLLMIFVPRYALVTFFFLINFSGLMHARITTYIHILVSFYHIDFQYIFLACVIST